MRQLVLRAAASILCAAVLVGIATAAVFFTAAPAIVSILVEPVSLLLLPGLAVALMAAGPHDFSPESVLYASFAWYIVFFYLIFTWRHRRRARLFRG